jgi:thiamine pyrophosphate-dependent acetolactate synthase large subunit-like protein
MYFHQAIAHALRDRGVEQMFGLVGDANLFLTDSFVREGGRYIAVTHESAAVLAAAADARNRRDVGVATVTHGPAVTNILTALIEVVRSRTPIVIVAGDTPLSDRDGLQNTDQRNVARAAGAGFELVRSSDTMAHDVQTAFRRARVERRPVLLDVPVDLQWTEMSYAPAPDRPVVDQPIVPADDELDEALGIIASARRPIVLAGSGMRNPAGRAAALDLARRIGAPVATTLKARDLFAGEPENIGICGTLSDERTISVFEQADCVVALGAGLTRWTTAEGAMLANKRTVHVDRSREALGAFAGVDAAVRADGRAVVAAFMRLLDDAAVPATEFVARVPAASELTFPPLTAEGTLDIRHVLRRLDARLPAERHVTLDCGRFFFHAAPLFGCGASGSYQHTVEFGSIGLGLGTAIGAAADGALPSVLVCGDGGLMLSGLAELTTAVRHGLDLVVVVLNDGAYGAEHIQLIDRDMDPSISEFDWPELADVATALGLDGYPVQTEAELDAAIEAIGHRTRPVLLNIHLSPGGIPSGPH